MISEMETPAKMLAISLLDFGESPNLYFKPVNFTVDVTEQAIDASLSNTYS
jgi:hypothetical protein